MLLYRQTAAKRAVSSATLFSYDFGVSELGRHPAENPRLFSGRRISIRATVMALGDADPDEAVRTWLATQARSVNGTRPPAVIVWPRRYVGKVIRRS